MSSTMSRSSSLKKPKKAKPKATADDEDKTVRPNSGGVKRPKSAAKQFPKKFPKTCAESSDTEMISASKSMPPIESLDAIIPVPKNFEGDNNPFCDTKHNVLLKSCLSAKGSVGSVGSGVQSPVTTVQTTTVSKERISNDKTSDDRTADEKSVPLGECLKGQNDVKINIVAQRVKPDGKVEYLVEWQN